MAAQQMADAIQTLTQQVAELAQRVDDSDVDTVTAGDLSQIKRDIQDLRQMINDNPGRGGGGEREGSRRKLQLISPKHLTPIVYTGRNDALHFRSWGLKTKNILNIHCSTFREVMTAAEARTEPIDKASVANSEWPEGAEGNSALHDFLLMSTAGEAHAIVASVPGNGLEAWRLLVKAFDPQGGQFDLQRFHQLTRNVPRAKNLSEVPKMLLDWTREVDLFESRSKKIKLDDHDKILVIMEMIPVKYAEEMQYKYAGGDMTFAEVKDHVQKQCALYKASPANMGQAPMELDSAEKTTGVEKPREYTDEDWI